VGYDQVDRIVAMIDKGIGNTGNLPMIKQP
jgi:hypothetical protein